MAAAGPAVSLVVALILFLLTSVVPERLESVGLMLQVTLWVNLVIGLVNLLPALPLDGGRLLRAGVWRLTGNPNRGTVAASWSGRILTILVLLSPFLVEAVLGRPAGVGDYVAAAFIAFHLWAGAESEIRSASLEHESTSLNVRDLARPVITLDADMPVIEAIGRQADARAGAILIRENHGPVVGIVSESALVATPRDRQRWLTLRSVMRTTGIDDRIFLSANISGFELLQAMSLSPATEYLLRESNGDTVGVVTASDVEDALGAGWALAGWLCVLEPKQRALFPNRRGKLF